MWAPVALATVAVALFLECRWFARQYWLPNPFQWQSLGLRAVAIDPAVGTCSHILLDNVTHSDITPLAPISDANPLYRLTTLPALHCFCLGSGVVALLILGIRQFVVRHTGRKRLPILAFSNPTEDQTDWNKGSYLVAIN